MLVIFAAVGLVAVFVIAAVAVGRESSRLSAQAPRPVFDLDEAVAWVAEQLPFEVSAVLSHEDVSHILRWNLEYLLEAGSTHDPASDDPALPPSPMSVVGEQQAVEHVLARAASAGSEFTPSQVGAVLEAQLAYLDLIGARGPAEVAGAPETDGN
jgi:hypothetical protein